jgi:hypothetical protein
MIYIIGNLEIMIVYVIQSFGVLCLIAISIGTFKTDTLKKHIERYHRKMPILPIIGLSLCQMNLYPSFQATTLHSLSHPIFDIQKNVIILFTMSKAMMELVHQKI